MTHIIYGDFCSSSNDGKKKKEHTQKMIHNNNNNKKKQQILMQIRKNTIKQFLFAKAVAIACLVPHLVFHAVIYDLSVGRLYNGDVDHEILKTYKIFIIKYVYQYLYVYVCV